MDIGGGTQEGRNERIWLEVDQRGKGKNTYQIMSNSLLPQESEAQKTGKLGQAVFFGRGINKRKELGRGKKSNVEQELRELSWLAEKAVGTKKI